ncbi:RNA-binding S4 domain-containing protein [Synechococcus sp. H70.1]|uniref:RNA-binding S4 domain-containing protein n=2 Tax=Synechococcus TaxID=1129 RepID=UPI0039C5E6A8
MAPSSRGSLAPPPIPAKQQSNGTSRHPSQSGEIMAKTLPPSQAPPPRDPYIKLDQFLKLTGVVATGGQAKQLIQAGQVRVNGEVETRRGRKLRPGDAVAVAGQVWQVRWEGARACAWNKAATAQDSPQPT